MRGRHGVTGAGLVLLLVLLVLRHRLDEVRRRVLLLLRLLLPVPCSYRGVRRG